MPYLRLENPNPQFKIYRFPFLQSVLVILFQDQGQKGSEKREGVLLLWVSSLGLTSSREPFPESFPHTTLAPNLFEAPIRSWRLRGTRHMSAL